MDIPTIKSHLPITHLLTHYGLEADGRGRLNCPFHEDRTPSMQVYPDSDSCYCFSGKCAAHGKRIDVIDFIQRKESVTIHQAIEKAKELAGIIAENPPERTAEKRAASKTKGKDKSREGPDSDILQRLEKTFAASIWMSPPARAYCQKRALDIEKLKGWIGYNSGQVHHAGRFKEGEEEVQEQVIREAIEVGMLMPLDRVNGRTGAAVTYRVFAKDCLTFFLRDDKGRAVGLYGRSTKDSGGARHFYLKNRKGLYPRYPSETVCRLILTESIIDAATLQQSGLPEDMGILALYGTNGMTAEHKEAIHRAKGIEEVIFCLDNDAAGVKASKRHGEYLRKEYPEMILSRIDLPDKDINQVAQGHQSEIFTTLIDKRTPLLFSSEKGSVQEAEKGAEEAKKPSEKTSEKLKEETERSTSTTPPFSEPNSETKPTTTPQKSPSERLAQIDRLIARSGIVGEEQSRLLLFIIASSYRSQQPLHAIVQGSSGSGKTHLIGRISELMPGEDVMRFTRITESALYNFSEEMLMGKLIVLEDLDGLKEEALLAFRELVSNHQVISGVSVKDKKGNIKSATKLVRGVFASMSATTKGAIYEDNMNRSFLLAVDESPAQSQRIIDHQNKRYAGEICEKKQTAAREELQQLMRDLQDVPVINPYATKLRLPETVRNRRRLNEMFQRIIKQIAWLDQKNRPRHEGHIHTQLEDIEAAIEVLFDSIILKIDEMEGSQRDFYQQLCKAFGEDRFSRFEAMEVTGLKKTQLQHHLNSLVQLEYLQQFGFSNRGFKYRIGHRDDIYKVRKDLKKHFKKQVDRLRVRGE